MSATTRLAGKAQTVLGPVAPERLGVTLMHEHILAHAPHLAKEPEAASDRALFHAPVTMASLGGLRYGRVVNRETLSLTDVDSAIEELTLYRQLGGQTVVEATSIGIGRDPAGLSRVARATGLNIVMGASYYVEETWPAAQRVAERSENDIRDGIIADVVDGAGGSGVRAGLIGEVGCSWPLTAGERKVLRASAAAQRATGAPLMIHPGRSQAAPAEILEVLRDAGADLARTIMCHIDRTIDGKPQLKRLAETGCVLEYDLFGFENSYYPWDLPVDMPNDLGRIRWLQWLIAEGHGDQLVISHDTYFKHHLVRYGGAGYGHILANVVPLMRRVGIDEAQIGQMLVTTPRRLLTFA